MSEKKRELWEVEKYFGVTFDEVEYGGYEYNVMMRIQTAWENGTSGNDISYYASLYGF